MHFGRPNAVHRSVWICCYRYEITTFASLSPNDGLGIIVIKQYHDISLTPVDSPAHECSLPGGHE